MFSEVNITITLRAKVCKQSKTPNPTTSVRNQDLRGAEVKASYAFIFLGSSGAALAEMGHALFMLERQLCFSPYMFSLLHLFGFGLTGITETKKAGVPAV